MTAAPGAGACPPNPILKAARAYLLAGYNVLPVDGSKRAVVSWKELQERFPSDGELAAWWPDGHKLNVALLTGPISGGLAVLDIDDLGLAARMVDDPALVASTVAIRTPRGGLHLWVTETDGPSQSGPLVPGVADLKAAGGYVLAPPSRTADGAYRALSKGQPLKIDNARAWALRLLQEYGVPCNPSRESEDNGAKPRLDVAAALEGLTAGNRNETFSRIAGRLHRDGWAASEIITLLAPHAEVTGFPIGELEGEVRGICRRYARPDAATPLQFVALPDFLAQEEQEPPCIIEGLVPTGAVVLLAGKPKLGKSLLGLNAALCVSAGAKWLGEFTTSPGPVIICALEDRPSLVRKRLRAMAGALGSGEVYVRCGGLHLDRPEDVEALSNEITKLRPVLVVIDPLIELHRGDENDARAMADAISPLRDLARRHECAFLIVHHRRKSPGPVGDTVRGSSAIFGAVDGVIVVRELGEADSSLEPAPLARLLEAQLRDGPPLDPFQISLDAGTLCFAYEGTFQQARNATVGSKIQDALVELGEATAQELGKHESLAGVNPGSIRNGLAYLLQEGLLEEAGAEKTRGRPRKVYRLVGP